MMPLGRSIGNFEYRTVKTGQTTEYGSGAGADDGYYEVGLSNRYEVLTAGQYSGTTNITINSKTDAHSNAVVIDHVHKLMWSRTLSASVGPASNGLLPWTTTGSGGTAEGIFPYAAATNAASLAGHNDWRVPNRNEAITLQDMEAANANPDATAFPSGWTTSVWSSTTVPSNTTLAVNVAFTSGGIAGSAKTNTALCALVRSV